MDCGKMSLRAALVQSLAALAIATSGGLTGLALAWPSYNVANFVSNHTVLSEPMTTLHVSLLGSLANIGAFLLTPFCGKAINTLGRRYTSILSGVPFVMSWSILSITNSVTWILIAMSLLGFGGAAHAASPIYIAELSHDSIRGALTTVVISIYFVGLLISYVLGGALSYSHVIYVQLSISIMYIVAVSLLKDSPVFLLQKGREKEAAESIAFYTQTSVTSKMVEDEIVKIKLLLDPRLENMLQEGKDPTVVKELIANPELQVKLSEWQFLKKSQSSTRALMTALVTMAIMVLMGNYATQVYAEPLFHEAVPSMDPNTCSIYLAIDFIAANVVCALLIDRFGRKFLMISSCIGSSICTLILGLQIQYQFGSQWCIAFTIYLYNFIFNIGVATIPYVMIAEYFLPEVRGLCASILMSAGWGMNFIMIFIFMPMVKAFGIAIVFYIISAIGFAGAIYSAFYQPETKGLSIDAIQLLFMKKAKRRIKA